MEREHPSITASWSLFSPNDESFSTLSNTSGLILKDGLPGFLAFWIGPFFILIGIILIFWGGVTIVAGPSTGNDPLNFVVFFSIVLLAYFITDLGKIVIAKQLKVFINGQTIVFVKSLLALILVISGIVLIIGGLQAA